MDTLLCKDDGAIVFGTNEPSNTLLRLSANQYTEGSHTWADQSGNGLDFTVSTDTRLKGTDADGFPYMDFNGTYGSATRESNILAPTTGKYTIFCVTQIKASTSKSRSLIFASGGDVQLIVNTGTNNLGLYNSGFVDSGFVVTEEMTNSRNLLVVELSQTETDPVFKFQLNESKTDSIINISANFAIPFNTIGTNGTNYWGNVYEFIVYDGVLSASARAFVAEYLAYKWAITEKLTSLTTTQGLIRNEETLAFLYAGSGTETTYTWDAGGVTYADVLIVGGGGGGKSATSDTVPGGGGGGGEVVLRQGVAVTPGVEIKVGRGGSIGTQGGISQFTSAIRANGGGSGDGNGGSGGGKSRNGTIGVSVKLGGGFGNDGGYSTYIYPGAGGGGGATQAGFIGSTANGTNGGEGYTANVFGVWNTVYGSGGGGGARLLPDGIGGTNAGNGGNPGTSGVANTGSGGGGGHGIQDGNVGPGAPGGSGIVLVKPNPGALDGLGTTIYTQAVGAYALRRLFGAYTGPQVRLRRSTDNVEVDVTFDKYGHLVDFDLTTWIGAATAYVTTWYDQSGEDNDLTQTNVTYQPKYDSRNKRVNLNNAYMTIPGSDNVAPFSTNQPTLVQRTSMVSFKAPSNLASNQAKNVYAKGYAHRTHTSDVRVWWYQDGNKLGSQHGDGLSTDPVGAYTSEEVVVYSVVEENSSSSVNATSHVLRENGVRQSDSVVSSSRTFTTEPNNYPWSIGYEGAGLRWSEDAYINEHIIFNTTLNDSVRIAVENEMQYHAIKNGPGVIPPLPLALQLGALDDLGVSLYNTTVGAYALRRLFGLYPGPQVRLHRSTDNAETDVYFSSDGFIQNLNLTTWLGGGTGYIVTWYDQGPNATHTTAYGTSATTFPSIYEREDGLYAVYFPGSSATVGGHFNAGSVTFNVATNGGVSTFSRVNLLGALSYERVYDYGNNLRDDNLILFRSSTTNNLMLEMYEGAGTNRSSITVSNGIVNNTWQSFGNRIQGTGSSWVFSSRIDGTENTQAISQTYTDRTITRSYIGRSNWSDAYTSMYLSCQIFFNTGAITSQQFAVMENRLF